MPARRATEALESYLRLQTLRVARRRGNVSVWEPSAGLAAKIMRGTDLQGRIRLKTVNGVTLCVTDDGSGGCVVQIDLDFTHTRRANRNGAAAAMRAHIELVRGEYKVYSVSV